MVKVKVFFLTVIIFLTGSLPAYASGYMIRLQSASALGNCFAGGFTGSHDLSDVFFNPACIFVGDGPRAQLSLSTLQPDSKYTHQSSSSVVGQPISGNLAGANILSQVNIPAFYAVNNISRGQRVGIAVNAPWGLKTQNPAGWVGRYHAVNTDLVSLNIMPVWGREIGERTFGAIGIQRQRVNATLDNAIDFGTIGAAAAVPGAVPGKMDGMGTVSGEAWGTGFSLGLLHEFDARSKVGVSFRSKVAHTLKGSAEFTMDPAGLGTALSGATGAFKNTGVTADLTTPYLLGLGYQNILSDHWTLLLDAMRTGWSEFQELRVRFDNPAQPDSVTNEKGHDTWFGSLGFQYKANERWTWRMGLAMDQGPVDDQYRVPRIPASANKWFSGGFTWKTGNDCWLDMSGARINYDDAPIRLSLTDTGSTFRGNLTGSFKTMINIMGLSLQLRF